MRFRRQEGLYGIIPALEGEGVFELAWLGIEECWEVMTDAGERVALFPCFGDTMEPV